MLGRIVGRGPRGGRLAGLVAAALGLGVGLVAPAAEDAPRTLTLQARFAPLFLADAPPGGAHPIGGPTTRFVETANAALEPHGLRFSHHVSGEVPPSDEGRVQPPAAELGDEHPTLHAAVAAGAVDAGVGLANMSGEPFGALLTAARPFGMAPDAFAAWLYDEGLALQQALYDEAFEGRLKVLPVAILGTQGGGWFPEPLPDPAADPVLDAEAAMRRLCGRPWIVRWPEPGAGVWRRACADVGVETARIGEATRCADASKPCPSDGNPVARRPESLAFGGFVFGGLPQRLALLGRVDAWELNMPYYDAMMMKLATGQGDVPNAEADLSPVIEATPHVYAATWHQPLSYAELIVNRDVWDGLAEDERRAIERAARASTLEAWMQGLALQDRGVALLREHGATLLRWPEGLRDRLRAATKAHLDERAAALAAEGRTGYRRVLESLRGYAARHADWQAFGERGRERALPPASPE
ncbi:MAG: hypothetical protein R6V44_10365 [Paracoccaceae bacterium]